jgi:predicted phage-related endonuclease
MSTNELDMKVDQIRELKRMIEEAEAEITSIEDTIKAQMIELDTDTMNGNRSKVTWKETSTTRIDSKALKKELPDVAARYSTTTTYRRFLIA